MVKRFPIERYGDMGKFGLGIFGSENIVGRNGNGEGLVWRFLVRRGGKILLGTVLFREMGI